MHSSCKKNLKLRACLHEGWGHQVGEVTCSGSPYLSCKRDQIKMRAYNYGEAGYLTYLVSPISMQIGPKQKTNGKYFLMNLIILRIMII